MKTVYNTEGEYGKQIVQNLMLPATRSKPEALEGYARCGKRLHWVNSNIVPGAFQMKTAWYYGPSAQIASELTTDGTDDLLGFMPHKHDSDEIIGFYGSNPDDPYDLGGEIELIIEDERHIITKSSLIFIPSGMRHAPLALTRVDHPIFYFSVIMDPLYVLKNFNKENA